MIDGPAERVAELSEQASRFGPGALTRNAELVSKGLSELKGATAPRLQLELLAARLVLPAADSGPESLVARVEKLERSPGVAVANGAAAPSPAPAEPQPESPAASAPAPTPRPKPAKPQSAPTNDAPPPPPRLSEVAPRLEQVDPRSRLPRRRPLPRRRSRHWPHLHLRLNRNRRRSLPAQLRRRPPIPV